MDTEKNIPVDPVEKEAEEQLDLPVSVSAWLSEINAALDREKDWRKQAEEAIDRYKNQEEDDYRKGGRFNILWSNTETIRNAVYNRPPSPDVRQRWNAKDPLALAVAQVLDRTLEYTIDASNFHDAASRAVLDLLLPGRSVVRVRYDPTISQEVSPDGVYYDTVTAENVIFEPVKWKDFIHSDAPDWSRVEWIAFRHYVSKADAKEMFPDYADEMQYTDKEQDEEYESRVPSMDDSKHTDFDLHAEVWEIWDRRTKQEIWITKGISEALVRQSPSLELSGFFPIARPMYAVPSPDTLMPTTLYSQYKSQAQELDIITARIEKTASIVRWRGVYDASMSTDLQQVMDTALDGDLVPTQMATAYMERGGFNNCLWLFPVTEAVKTLSTLYESRDRTKQTIYEITGISDILRGVTNAQETATAQQIKAAWGSSRIDGFKRDIQRFLCDTLRIAAEVIGENYQTDTLSAITGLNYPTAQQQAEAQMKMQEIQLQAPQAQMAAQQGNPQAVEYLKQAEGDYKQAQKVLEKPSWEDIENVLHSDLLRSYRVEIETDSTLAPNYQQNLEELSNTMNAIGMFGQQFLPGVQNGIIPIQLFMSVLYAVIQKTPLSNLLAEKFNEYITDDPASPLQKQIDQLKEELKAAQDEAAYKNRELDLKAAEIKQKGMLEVEKLKLDAADIAQKPAMQANELKQKMIDRVIQGIEKTAPTAPAVESGQFGTEAQESV